MNPPFRAEHVGSLLRPAALKRAFRQHREGGLDAAGYERALLEAIRGAVQVQVQENAGLESITDGELGRNSWFGFFFERMDGFRLEPATFRFRDAEGGSLEWPTCFACERMRRRAPIALQEHRRLAALTRRTPKMTLPAPSAFHFFRFQAPFDRAVYADEDAYWNDLVEVYRAEIAALGGDPDALVSRYLGVLQRILAGRPAGMTVGMHLCRGNFRGRWMASGGYEPVAERLFDESPVDAFFLEYDSERAGDFAPQHHVPMDCLALSPQCGFASVAGGNLLTEEEQAAKLRLVVEVAQAVWG